MKNEQITVEAVAFSVETVNLSEVETMEESFAASSDTTKAEA
jgi:hypothetical protein